MTPLRGLTERQRAVVATMRMRLTRAQAMAYLQGEGYPMGSTTLGRIKSWLRRTELQRLHYIAAIGFETQHLERIDTCELMAQLHWKNFHLEKSPYKKSMILREIRELQPYISTYYDTTRGVIEKANGTSISNRTREADNSIPEYSVTKGDTGGPT